MVEQIIELLPVILIGIILWLFGLTVVFYWIFVHYKKLGRGVKSGNLVKVIDGLVDIEKSNIKAIDEVKTAIATIEKDSLKHIQKLGLVRFNPFNETGGDQSFSLCLLDNKENGFMISCLHTRDRTRVYAKPISAGKSEYDFSKEEKKALDLAKKS